MSKSKLSRFAPFALFALTVVGGCALTHGGDDSSASQLVKANEGAVVCTPDRKAHVTIPAGALSTDTTITIDPADAPPQASGYTLVGPGYEFGPSGTHFATPAQIELHYDETKLPLGVSPQSIGILAVSDGGAKVELLQHVTVDPSQHAVFGDTSHFTWFAPIVGPSVQLGGPGGTPNYGVATTRFSQRFDIWVGPDGLVRSDSNVYSTPAPTSLSILVTGAAPSTTLRVTETLEDPAGPGTPWDAMPSLFNALSTTQTDASGNLLVTIDGHTLQNEVETWTRQAPGYPSGRVHITVYTPAPVELWVSLAKDPLAP